jgi:hypothetical protein
MHGATIKVNNMRLFENRVPRVRRDDVTGEWRRLRNEELHDLYCSPVLFGWSNQGWSRRVVRTEKKRNTYSVLVWKREGKNTFGRPRRRGVNGIKIHNKKRSWSRA